MDALEISSAELDYTVSLKRKPVSELLINDFCQSFVSQFEEEDFSIDCEDIRVLNRDSVFGYSLEGNIFPAVRFCLEADELQVTLSELQNQSHFEAATKVLHVLLQAVKDRHDKISWAGLRLNAKFCIPGKAQAVFAALAPKGFNSGGILATTSYASDSEHPFTELRVSLERDARSTDEAQVFLVAFGIKESFTIERFFQSILSILRGLGFDFQLAS